MVNREFNYRFGSHLPILISVSQLPTSNFCLPTLNSQLPTSNLKLPTSPHEPT